MFCKKCGKEISGGALFCRYCGERVATVEKAHVLPESETYVKYDNGNRRPEKTAATAAPKKKRGKIALVTIIIVLVVAAIAAAGAWAWINLGSCEHCGSISEYAYMKMVYSPDEGDLYCCDECWQANRYGGDGFTFYTFIELESAGSEEYEIGRFYQWKTEDECTEVEVDVFFMPDDISEDEQDDEYYDAYYDYFKEVCVDVYGDDLFEHCDYTEMFGHEAYSIWKDDGVYIFAYDEERIYMFNIMSDSETYVDTLHTSILNCDNY